jgi:hypothetical protein
MGPLVGLERTSLLEKLVKYNRRDAATLGSKSTLLHFMPTCLFGAQRSVWAVQHEDANELGGLDELYLRTMLYLAHYSSGREPTTTRAADFISEYGPSIRLQFVETAMITAHPDLRDGAVRKVVAFGHKFRFVHVNVWFIFGSPGLISRTHVSQVAVFPAEPQPRDWYAEVLCLFRMYAHNVPNIPAAEEMAYVRWFRDNELDPVCPLTKLPRMEYDEGKYAFGVISVRSIKRVVHIVRDRARGQGHVLRNTRVDTLTWHL